MVCSSDPYQGLEEDDRPWSNWVGSVQYDIEKYWEPKRLEDLVHVVSRATKEGKELRPLGSGWAYGDIAASADWVVNLGKMSKILKNVVPKALTDDWKAVQDAENSEIRLVHVEAGIEIGNLNLRLEDLDLGMITLGGANGQNLAGAISTSTHGGDPLLPPLAGLVQAIHLVTVGGQELWIERSSEPPITRNDLLLPLLCTDALIKRDDNIFNAVLVSAGRFGVIYSFVLKVASEAYWLAEWAVKRSRQNVFDFLQTGIDDGTLLAPLIGDLPDPAAELNADTQLPTRFVEILFNSQDPSSCWITRRWPTTDESERNMEVGGNPLCDATFASLILATATGVLEAWAQTALLVPVVGLYLFTRAHIEIAKFAWAATHGVRGGAAVALVVNALWGLGAGVLIPPINQLTLQSNRFDKSEKGRRGVGHEIMTGTRATNQDDCYKGDSIEVIFPANTKAYLDYLNALFPVAPSFHQAGYVSLRYSKTSKAHISMHNFPGAMAVSIEIASLTGLEGNEAWLRFAHDLAVSFGGRPHWGQINTLTVGMVDQLYGTQINTWREALVQVSGTSSTFSNNYTRQRGLEPKGLLREVTRTRKDKQGRITHLCGGPDAGWGPVPRRQAMDEIKSGLVHYFTRVDGKTARVQAVENYLRTTADTTTRNNLDLLPGC